MFQIPKIVKAKASGELMVDYEDIQLYENIVQELADEIKDIDPQCSAIYNALKTIVKTLNGISCALNEVLKIQVAAHQFLVDVAACGGEVNHKVQTLINAVKDIVETCKAIGGINEHVCANDHDDRSTRGVVSSIKAGHKCAANMFHKLLRFCRQVKRVIKLIIQIKDVPGDIGKCVLDAVDALEKSFTECPSKIKACANVPSNKQIFLQL